MVKMVAAIGESGSGKTTTLEYLISHLTKEGFKVGVAKHIHHPGFTVDTEGKDTWRHARAGAKTVVMIAPEEVAIIKKGETGAQSLEDVIRFFEKEKLDIIFLEGFHRLVSHRGDVDKFITAKDSNQLKKALKTVAPPILAVTGLVVAKRDQFPNSKVPFIDLHRDGGILVQIIKKRLAEE